MISDDKKQLSQGETVSDSPATSVEPRSGRPIQSGAYSRRRSVLAERARKVYSMTRRMLADMPWLERSDRHALRAFCELEYLCAAMWNELDKGRDIFGPDGNVRRIADDYRKFRQTQMALMQALGLTPVARKLLSASGNAPSDLVAEFARANAARGPGRPRGKKSA